MTEGGGALEGRIAPKFCATSISSCFDRLSMRVFFHLVLSLSKGGVGTASTFGARVLFFAGRSGAA